MYHNNKNYGQKINYGNMKMYPRKNVQVFKGQVCTNNPKFQVNNFDKIVTFRFNSEFVKQFLTFYKESNCVINSEFVSNLIDDFSEIIVSEDECFITDNYHMGKYLDAIYLNLDVKFLNIICQIANALQTTSPAFFKFKEMVNKLHFFSLQSNIDKAENF